MSRGHSVSDLDFGLKIYINRYQLIDNGMYRKLSVISSMFLCLSQIILIWWDRHNNFEDLMLLSQDIAMCVI